MRKALALTTAVAFAAGVAFFGPASHAQPYYGGMMGGYGGGGYYGMGPGMMYGYGGGYGPGAGMMYGYGPDGQRYYNRRGQSYRGKRLCWHQTDTQANTGYYEPCAN